MVTATRSSATARHRRSHEFYPMRAQFVPNGPSMNTTSSQVSYDTEIPNVDELRRVRAQCYNTKSEDRRKKPQKEMASYTSQRRESISRSMSARIPEVTVREGRRKHETTHRRRRERAKEDGDEGKVYVYRYVDDDPRDDPTTRSTLRRRASAPKSSKLEPSRSYINESDLSRRQTERRLSHRRDWESSTSRNQRRSSSSANILPSIARSASLREFRAIPILRPSLARSQSTTHKSRQASRSTPSNQLVEEKVERRTSSAKKTERSSKGFGSIFSLPKPPDPKPEKQIECLTCLSSDIPISKSAKLACKHRMCHSCLRRIFSLSVSDPQHMPPKCCTQDHIPLKHVEKLFDVRFKMKWNQKYQEYTTKNRIYCPAKGCGEWIKPSHIYTDTSGGANTGRKYGKCTRCRTKVCCTCNGKWHTSRECPKDEATQRFAEIAKEEGWQRCFNCSATVELKEGCNHMTCRCRAEFCMICGLKWKTCDCPWFNYAAVENDRLMHMNVPRRPPHPNPALGYQEELDRRREQERRDENLARRIQVLGLDGDENDFVFRPPPPPPNFARHMANLLSGAGMLNPEQIAAFAPPPPPPPPPPAPPAVIHIPPAPANRQHSRELPLRHHSVASRLYNNRPTTRESERVVPRRISTNYETEAQRHRPSPVAASEAISEGMRNLSGAQNGGVRRTGSRHSAMAGLTRGSGQGRVDEWRRHVGSD